MIYKCLIADDNVIERHMLVSFLKKIPNVKIVAECESGVEAAVILGSQPVDIVFSDIEMPDLNGINLLKSLRNPPVFIFITSFVGFAAESYDLDVIDFISKPVKFERLMQAANKAIEYLQLKTAYKAQQAPEVVSETGEKEVFADEYCFIKETKGITKLKYADVLYIESMGDFSKIITIHHHTHIVLSSLKSLLEQLPPALFKRVHKQYVVNVDNIHTVTPTEIHFHHTQVVPVSSLYRQEVLDAFVKKGVIKRKND